ncbi:MAG: zinc-binding alcohol dehydrogenase [Pseudomonadota bacterium]|nr:zinc-binding alcohol dehydrogenase [Pseudomonadota bacterium]
MKKINAKSFWVKKKNFGFIKEHSIDKPKASEALIKTIYSGISFGTERIVFTGSVPKNQTKVMKCPHQEGEFGSNVKYGYLNVGKVIKGSQKFKGKFVFTLFPHQNFFVLKEDDLVLIPKSVPKKRCLLIANMETALNAIWDTSPTSGDTAIVVGAGIVGFMVAYLLKSTKGIDVTIIDKDKTKNKYAKHFDINFSNKIKKSSKVDFIYECSGNPNILNQLSTSLKEEGILCILSWYGNQVSKMNFGENFFSKRLKIVFSQVSKIPKHRMKDWNNKSRRELAMKMLGDQKLDKLIERKEIKFEDLPKFFDKNRVGKNYMCNVVKYS